MAELYRKELAVPLFLPHDGTNATVPHLSIVSR
jgi:hypothetical protein